MNSEQSSIDRIARTNARTHEIRRSEEGIFIKPRNLDSQGEFHLSMDELGEALRLVGWNRADLFPEG